MTRWERRKENNRLKSVPILVAEFLNTRVVTEDDLHIATVSLINALGWFHFHCPNGGKRGKVEAGRFVAMGVLPGVSDIIISEDWECWATTGNPDEPCPYCGIFDHGVVRSKGSMVALELKAPGEKASKEQLEFIANCSSRGWMTAVCDNAADVLRRLKVVRPKDGRKIP